MKVLLLDDSAIMRMMLKSLLKQVDITDVTEAGNGLEGLQQLARSAYDLIILDMHMPQMDGPGFLAEMRKRPEWAGIPAIVVSSDTESQQMEEARRLGAKAYIAKPFRLEGLRKALDTALPPKR